jgi:hypothetical protein
METDELTSTTATPQPVVVINPLLVPVKQACAIIGRSQSALYELLARGEIEGVKSDGRTLIRFQSLQSYVDRLPKATFAPPRRRKPPRDRSPLIGHDKPPPDQRIR